MLRSRRIAGFHQLSQLQVTPLWHLPVDICLWTFPAHLNYAETQHEFNILTSFLKWIWSKLSRTASGFQLSRFLLKLGQNLVKAKKSMKFTAHLNYPVIQHKLNQVFFHLEPSSSPDFWSTSGQFFCITQNFRPNSAHILSDQIFFIKKNWILRLVFWVRQFSDWVTPTFEMS